MYITPYAASIFKAYISAMALDNHFVDDAGKWTEKNNSTCCPSLVVQSIRYPLLLMALLLLSTMFCSFGVLWHSVNYHVHTGQLSTIQSYKYVLHTYALPVVYSWVILYKCTLLSRYQLIQNVL